MSNFIETFKMGQEGKNSGYSTGSPALDMTIKKLKKSMIIGLAAAPKCGKTTFADWAFVINPYLDAISKGTVDKIEWIYNSFEVTRVEKEFKFAAFFFANDHNIYHYTYKGVTYKLDDDYLMGAALHRVDDTTTEIIPVSNEHFEILKIVYRDRIIPLFGEWSSDNKLVTHNTDGSPKPKPKIHIIEESDNPTGVYKFLMAHAAKNGKFLKERYEALLDDHKTLETRERIVGYNPNDPDMLTIVMTDHIRALKDERGYTKKQNIDKFMEYSRVIKKLTGYSFVHVMHSNRGVANVDRLKFQGENIFPTSDDVKDSGNPAEDCTVFMTLFNPNDEKYNLDRHMGYQLSEYPFYRSLHITEQRRGPCPVHIQFNMLGGINMFTPI